MMDVMLTIKDFSEVSGLSARTLRYYHDEGLLVPADVQEPSLARRYTLEQLPRALLVSAMRRAGMGVQQVRRVLDEAGPTAEVLQQHRAVLDRQRAEEDEALAELFAAVENEPEVRCRRVGAVTALAAALPERFDDVVDDAGERVATSAVVQTLCRAADERGWPAGAPRTWVERSGGLTVELPVQADPVPLDLPDGLEVRRRPPAAEAYVLLPGRHQYSRLVLASWHLARAFLEGAVAGVPQGAMGDFRLRWVESGDLTEYAMGLVDEGGRPIPGESTDPVAPAG